MAIRLNPLTRSYGWNERAGRYIDLSSGRFVARRVVTDELENVIRRSASNIDAVSARLAGQEVGLVEWRQAMADEIKRLHTAAGAAARGGWAQMSQADWGAVGAEIKRQYRFLDNFASQIANGEVRLDGRFRMRARMYAEAARTPYQQIRRRTANNHGAILERRRLEPGAEHCSDTGVMAGCVTLAGKGWQAIGSLPRIGDTPCRTHCRCNFEFRDANGDTVL